MTYRHLMLLETNVSEELLQDVIVTDTMPVYGRQSVSGPQRVTVPYGVTVTPEQLQLLSPLCRRETSV